MTGWRLARRIWLRCSVHEQCIDERDKVFGRNPTVRGVYSRLGEQLPCCNNRVPAGEHVLDSVGDQRHHAQRIQRFAHQESSRRHSLPDDVEDRRCHALVSRSGCRSPSPRRSSTGDAAGPATC